VIAAFGYMSLRSHLNSIGISTTEFLGMERYLMEAQELASALLVLFVTSIPLLLVGSCACLLLVFCARRTARRSRFLRLWLERSTDLRVQAAVLMIGSAGLAWYASQLTYSLKHDWAVGSLDIRRLPAQDFRLPFIVLVCGASLAWHRILSRSANFLGCRRHWALRVSLLFLLLAGLNVPLIFGHSFHNLKYALANVQTETAASCGLLVLQSDSALFLWSAHGGFGRISVIPRSEVKEMLTYYSLQLAEQVQIATTQQTTPICGAGELR
jgi:hypothetical protein